MSASTPSAADQYWPAYRDLLGRRVDEHDRRLSAAEKVARDLVEIGEGDNAKRQNANTEMLFIMLTIYAANATAQAEEIARLKAQLAMLERHVAVSVGLASVQ